MATRDRVGFTLIELLVAMSMLVVIVLIVGMFFQRASVAWDTGERKAKVLLTGRAVADFISQEMQMAVPVAPFTASGSSASFVILGDATGTRRATQSVSYAWIPGNGVVNRTGTNTVEMCDGVSGLEFKEGPVNGSDILPLWVDIKVSVSNEVGPDTVFQSRASFPNRGREG